MLRGVARAAHHLREVSHRGVSPLRVGACTTHPVGAGLAQGVAWPVHHPPATRWRPGGARPQAPATVTGWDRPEGRPAHSALGNGAHRWPSGAASGPSGPVRRRAEPAGVRPTRAERPITPSVTSASSVTSSLPRNGSRRGARAEGRRSRAAGGAGTGGQRRSDRDGIREIRAQAPRRRHLDPGMFPWLDSPPCVTSRRTPASCGVLQTPSEFSTEARPVAV